MTPTANAIEVISTRPSGTIGTSAPTIRSSDSRNSSPVSNCRNVFSASGHCGAKVISSYNACRSDGPNVGLLTNSWV